jgi:Glyoxalase-like domain
VSHRWRCSALKMALILELIAPQRAGAVEGSDWAKFMAANAGACAWAVGVADINREVARVTSSGVKAEGTFPGTRKRPDGTVLAESARRHSYAGATLPFMIQDKGSSLGLPRRFGSGEEEIATSKACFNTT